MKSLWALGLTLALGLTPAACAKTPIGPDKSTEPKEAVSSMDQKPNPGAGLPHEPGSSSEILAATHVFLVEVEAMTASPWAVEADGLEHRNLNLTLRLVDLYKGNLDVEKGKTFPATVPQARESEFVVSDYHGIWSHESPEPKTRYLVVAEGQTRAPAALLTEETVKRLLPGDRAGDLPLAIAAEAAFVAGKKSGTGDAAELAAARALLEHADDVRAKAQDVYGRYLVARLRPVFLSSNDRPVTPLLDLVTDDDATLPLRTELSDGLYELTLALEPNPDLSRKVVRGLLTLLLDDAAKSLRPRLVNAQLHSLVFDPEDHPKLRGDDVVKSASEREKLTKILGEVRSDRANKLAAWLAPHP